MQLDEIRSLVRPVLAELDEYETASNVAMLIAAAPLEAERSGKEMQAAWVGSTEAISQWIEASRPRPNNAPDLQH